MLYRNRPYAGKKESKWAKHVIIAIIAITAVVSLWTLLLSNYIIIDQNGVRLSFINKPPAPVPTDDGGFTVVIVTPTATPIIPTEAPVEEKYGVIDAMYLDGSELRANGAQKVLSHYNNGTINAVVINMKDKEGVSYFDYETAVKTLTDAEGLTVIASVSAFLDETAARELTGVALMHKNGVAWLDGNFKRWLDPESDVVYSYIKDIISKVEALGFDEIVFENFTYPTSGYVEDMKAASIDKVQSIFNAATKITEEYDGGMLMSVMLNNKAAESLEDSLSGQKFSRLISVFDRVYCKVNHSDEASVLRIGDNAAMNVSKEDIDARVVYVLENDDAEFISEIGDGSKLNCGI